VTVASGWLRFVPIPFLDQLRACLTGRSLANSQHDQCADVAVLAERSRTELVELIDGGQTHEQAGMLVAQLAELTHGDQMQERARTLAAQPVSASDGLVRSVGASDA